MADTSRPFIVTGKSTFVGSLVEQDADLGRLVNQEELILGVTELIHKLLEVRKLTRTDLANRLGKTKGFVSQLLDGQANMTLRTLADILHALNCKLKLDAHDDKGPIFLTHGSHTSSGVVWCSESQFEKWFEPSSASSLVDLAS